MLDVEQRIGERFHGSLTGQDLFPGCHRQDMGASLLNGCFGRDLCLEISYLSLKFFQCTLWNVDVSIFETKTTFCFDFCGYTAMARLFSRALYLVRMASITASLPSAGVGTAASSGHVRHRPPLLTFGRV